jgi:sarcosine oxidase
MGSATAWWLARRGVRVVVHEQFEPLHKRGSSHGGSRIFRLAYPDRHFVDMARTAVGLWRELEEDAGEPLLDTTGSIDHGDPASVQLIAAALGDECEWLPGDAAAERWPGIRFEGPVLLQSDGGRCRADATVAALQRRAAELGADFQFESPVDDVTALDADVVVVTAGAWVGKLLGLSRTTVTQEQAFHFAPTSDAGEWPSFIHHRDPFIYGLETPGEGVKVAEHHTGAVVDPDARDFDIDPDGRARVRQYVRDWLPGLVPEPVSEVTCLYTSTPDQSFILERRDNIVIGSACSGHGFKFTPLIGRTLADLATT